VKQNGIKIGAYSSTILLVVLFLSMKEDVIYKSFVGILLLVLWLISLGLIFVSTLQFDSEQIQNGDKHIEKPVVLFLLLNMLTLLLSIIKGLSYWGFVGWFSLWSLSTLMGFLVVLFLLSYFMNYVIIEEDSLRYQYVGFSKTKTVHYKDIDRITFGGLMNTIKLHTKDGWYLIDITLKNADKIINDIYKNTTSDIHELAFLKLERYYKLFGLNKNLTYLEFFTQKD